jgi:hypothetical protein
VGNIRGFLFAGAVATVAVAAISVNAQESINYQYDARGRLVNVSHTGTVNNNVSANYSYDKGGNRTNVNVISPN